LKSAAPQFRRRLGGVAAGAIALAIANGAAADVIDGDWCNASGRHFSIRGPDIVTPGGIATKGDWTRHSFTYEAPPSEPEAGQTIFMLLQNENTVALAVGARPTASEPTRIQIWHRCAEQVSQLRH
jgi:hypothetical protein